MGNGCCSQNYPPLGFELYLPQKDPDTAGRDKEIKKSRKKYEYLAANGLPPHIKDFPEDEDFGEDTRVDFFYSSIRGALNGKLSEAINRFKPVDSLDDWKNFYRLYEPPVVKGTWVTDWSFCQQRLSGVNPYIIKRVEKKLPKGCCVRDEDIRHLPGARSIKALIKDRNLYICDYEEINDMTTKPGTYAGCPYALFYVHQNELKPLAIQLERAIGPKHDYRFKEDDVYVYQQEDAPGQGFVQVDGTTAEHIVPSRQAADDKKKGKKGKKSSKSSKKSSKSAKKSSKSAKKSSKSGGKKAGKKGSKKSSKKKDKGKAPSSEEEESESEKEESESPEEEESGSESDSESSEEEQEETYTGSYESDDDEETASEEEESSDEEEESESGSEDESDEGSDSGSGSKKRFTIFTPPEEEASDIGSSIDSEKEIEEHLSSPAKLTWLYAKMCVQNADSQVHQFQYHLTHTHLFSEVFYIALRRTLSIRHPIFQLCKPHYYFTLAINNAARETLISKGGAIDRTFAAGYKGALETVRRTWAGYNFQAQEFRTNLANRGVDDLPHFHFREDASDHYEALTQYVGDVLGHYYDSREDIVNDVELAALLEELESEDGGQVKGMPKVEDPDELIHFITEVLFLATIGHAALNFTQWDYMSYVPNYPLALHRKLPKNKYEIKKQEHIVRALPNQAETAFQILFANLLVTPSASRLGHYPEDTGHAHPNRVFKVAADTYLKNLHEIDGRIKYRNSKERRVPYPYLLSEKIPNSIAI